MVYFQTKNPNLGKFWRALASKCWYILWTSEIFYDHLRYFNPIWYILCSFVIFFIVFGIMYQEKSGNTRCWWMLAKSLQASGLNSILWASISAEKFSDKFLAKTFGQIFIQNFRTNFYPKLSDKFLSKTFGQIFIQNFRTNIRPKLSDKFPSKNST
jgi:hypothetical protein